MKKGGQVLILGRIWTARRESARDGACDVAMVRKGKTVSTMHRSSHPCPKADVVDPTK